MIPSRKKFDVRRYHKPFVGGFQNPVPWMVAAKKASLNRRFKPHESDLQQRVLIIKSIVNDKNSSYEIR